jgi:VWFA-related protein
MHLQSLSGQYIEVLLVLTGLLWQHGPVHLSSSLVLVPVVVQQKDGTPITDLTQADFLIYEGRKRRSIAYFDKEELPLHVALVLEPPNASSQAEAERMREQLNRPERDVSPPGLPTTQEMFRRWAAIQVAALKVLEVLGSNDGVALFTTCGELRHPLTNDLTVIRENIRELAATIQICPSGHFLDRDELIAISSYLRQASSGRSQRVIVIISDNHIMPRKPAPSLDEVRKAILAANVTVCGIGVENRGCATLRRAFMAISPPLIPLLLAQFKDIAYFSQMSGGIVVPADSSSSAEAISRATSLVGGFLQRLRQSYILGFWPDEQAKVGEVRGIKIELTPPARRRYPHVQLHYRRSYVITERPRASQ